MYEIENLIERIKNDLFQYANNEFDIKRISVIATEQLEKRERLKSEIEENEKQVLTILKQKYEKI